MKQTIICLISGCVLASGLFGTQPYAQTAAPGFVPLPGDISCAARGMMFFDQPGNMNGYVGQLVCWLSAKSPRQEKEIALTRATPSSAARFNNGMLQTAEFGNLQIDPTHKDKSGGPFIAIAVDKLQSFSGYLEK